MNDPAVLITGACGRIGLGLTEHLRGRFDLRLSDRMPQGLSDVTRDPCYRACDLGDTAGLTQLCDGMQIVVHLAGESSPSAPWSSLLKNNMEGTQNLLMAADRAGCSRVVLASSVHVMTGYPPGHLITPDDPVNPLDLYGVSKCFVEAAGRFTAIQRGLSVLVLRIGAFQSRHLPYPSFRRWELNEYIDPEDFFDLIERTISTEGPHFAILHAVGDNRPSRFDISGTRRLLGWRPRWGSHHLTQNTRSCRTHDAGGDRYVRALVEEGRMLDLSQTKRSAARSGEEVREDRHRKLAAAFRLFGSLGFDEGVAGHITARDPDHPDRFWVNPFGVGFDEITMSDLVLIDHQGHIVQGGGDVNRAAFAIHSEIHRRRPEIVAVAHAHSTYGRAFASLGRPLEPINQNACVFFGDHVVFDRYTGPVFATDEARRIAEALADNKAAILRNHGLLTVGLTVDEAAWWFVAMERSCQVQLLAEAAGEPVRIEDDVARAVQKNNGGPDAGWYSFQPLYRRMVREHPDFLT